MKSTRYQCAFAVAIAAIFLSALPLLRAQTRDDPLTRQEADAIRNASDQPGQRLELLLGFARNRLQQFQQVQKGNSFDRGDRLYSLLEQYTAIISELDDNVDELMSGHVTGEMSGPPKPRKPMEKMITGETDLLQTLQTIRKSSSPADLGTYHDELDDAIDSTTESLSNSKADLVEIAHREEAEKARKKQQKMQAEEAKKAEKQEKKEAKER
jgi:hypothetical protein